MALTYREEVVSEYTRKVEDKIICELCGAEGQSDWGQGAFDILDTTVHMVVKGEEGSSYPEGGWKTEYWLDICPDCFKEKLVPWFEEQGGRVREKEVDW
jgi:hypothetical protein